MSSKKKFKRDYIILEAKDINFRNKERVLPKAFAKVEVNDGKSIVALYVENLKYIKDGYDTMAITTKYDVLDLGKIVLNDQGRGEFILDLDGDEDDIKSIAIVHEDKVPLIGFKGNKLENYEDILFAVEEEYEDEYDEEEEYDEEYEEYDEDEEYDEEYDEYTDESELDVGRDSEDNEEDVDYVEEDNNSDEAEDESNDEEYEEEYNRDEDFDEEDEFEYEDSEYRDDFDEEDDYFDDEEDEFLEDSEEEVFERDNTNSDYNGDDLYQNENISNDEMVELNNFNKIQYREKYADDDLDEEDDPVKYVSNRKKVINKSYKTSKQEEEQVENHEQSKTPGTLMMPRQIKKGLKYFKEVMPFVDDQIDNTRWWKIDINPTTLCGYSMPNLGYVNALNYTMYSDVVINAYKHRHYLFGVQYDDYNKRKHYIYAIPGAKNEKPDNGNTGFIRFQSSDNRSNSNVGYWMCLIDARLRSIVK